MRDQTSVSAHSWYAVHIRSNHEKTVLQSLIAREYECYLPLYESLRRWRDRQVTLELPLFPGYGFVRMSPAERTGVLSVPGVVQVLCHRNVHDAISDELIDTMRSQLDPKRAEPHEFLAVGDEVTIMSGPFSGMEGTLIKQKGGARVVILVPAIVRAFSIEIDLREVRSTPRRPQAAMTPRLEPCASL